MVRGPMIGPVTPGWRSDQARAVRGPLAQLVAERLVLLDLRAVLLQPLALLLADGAALSGLAQRPAEQPAGSGLQGSPSP